MPEDIALNLNEAGRTSAAGGPVLLLTIISVGAGAAGFLNQAMQASHFGTTSAMDAYVAVASVPNLLSGIIPSVVLATAVPRLVSCAHPTYLSWRLLRLSFAIATAIVLIGWCASGVVARTLVVSNDVEILRGARIAFALLSCSTGLMVIVGALTAINHARSTFVLPSAISAVSSIGAAASVCALGSRYGIISIAIGCALGAGTQAVVLLWAVDTKVLRRSRSGTCGDLRSVVSNAPWAVLSQLPFTTPAVISAFWCSTLQLGGLAHIGYALSMAGVLSVIISTGAATISLPLMSRRVSGEDGRSVGRDLAKTLGSVLLFGVPAVTFVIVLRIPLLTVLLNRGAFDSASVLGTGAVLPYFAVAALCIGCMNVLRNAYYSTSAFRRAAVLGCTNPIVFFVLCWLLARTMGYGGVALAYSVAWMSFTAVAMVLVPGCSVVPHWMTVWRSIRGTVAMTAAAAAISECVVRYLDTDRSVLAFAVAILPWCACLPIPIVKQAMRSVDVGASRLTRASGRFPQ